MNRARYHSYLLGHGADTTPHVDGTLLEHLEGTCDLLEAWGNSDRVALAGLLHTAYGTDGFPLAFHGPDARATFAELVGPDVESLVYLYGSCDRNFLYPQLERLVVGSRRTLAARGWNAILRACRLDRDVAFRDRFGGRVARPEPALFRDFLELTFANEIELIRRAHPLPEPVRLRWERLFRPCLPMLGAAANAAFRDHLASPGVTTFAA